MRTAREIRTRVVSAVATSVVLPLMIVMYLMSRWASGRLNSPGTIVVLVLLALVLIGGGLNILRTIDSGEPPPATVPAPGPSGDETEADTSDVG
ncbi:MAG: hypothetical protein GXP31_00830 [Kiritimatiellaeota bacterium]|nr:hypothetical protein [Kiritimatiellota bacterium]